MVTPGGALVALPDPATGDQVWQRQLLRATTRQLMSYDPVGSLADRQDPKPDLTTFADPSDDKLSYRFPLRDVRWPAPLDRPLVADDVVRGIERLCWPGARSPDLEAFARVVAGLLAWCRDLAIAAPSGDPGQVASYIAGAPVPGLVVRGARALEVRLDAPAGDALNVLALPAAAPVPQEAALIPPGDARLAALVPALGPYLPVLGAALAPDGHMTVVALQRNPAWRQETDPLRQALVDRIDLVPVPDSAAGARAVAAGTLDVVLGGAPAAEVAAALGARPGDSVLLLDPRVRVSPSGDGQLLVSRSAAAGACAQALAEDGAGTGWRLVVDRRAAADALGAPLAARPATSLLPAGVLGHVTTGLEGTPGGGGDLAAARSSSSRPGLARVRCRLGVDRAPGTGAAPGADLAAGSRVSAAALAAALAPGFRALGVDLVPTRAGEAADLVLLGWTASWRGNAARGQLSGLLARELLLGGAGGASAEALAAQTAVTAAAVENDQNLAAARWADAARAVSAVVPVVPLVDRLVVSLTARRVGFRWYDLGIGLDLANASIADASAPPTGPPTP